MGDRFSSPYVDTVDLERRVLVSEEEEGPSDCTCVARSSWVSSTPVPCGSPNERSSCVRERSMMDAEEVVLSSCAAGAGTSGLWALSAGCSSSRAANSVGGAATDVADEDEEASTEESGTAGTEDEGEITNTPSS